MTSEAATCDTCNWCQRSLLVSICFKKLRNPLRNHFI